MTPAISQFEDVVSMDAQGRVVLPKKARLSHSKYFNFQTEEDGTIHLTPVVGFMTSKQAYFWTKRWQQGEKKASEDIKKGRFKKIKSSHLNAYLASLRK